MASPNSELSLDCKPHSSSSSYSMLLKSFGDQADQTQKLEEILAHLEEERFKIDGLKRELPLCMQLLSNAMEASRQQLQAYRANHHDHHHQGATITKPVLEEFMPLKLNSSTPSENNPDQSPSRIPDNKANWMTTAQLWSPTGAANNNETILPHNTIAAAAAAAGNAKESSGHDDEDHRHLHHAGFNLSLDSKQRINNGGAFLPFSKERNSPTTTLRDFPDLALASSDHNKNNMDHHHHHDQENENKVTSNENIHHQVHQVNGGGGNASEIRQTNNSINNNNNSSHRKARRCWSPDLHRRFVNALQMLGGSQVATPKQIRELMKVDGLTNDEVKSHLQKYRLHTRRPSPSPQAVGAPAQHLVVVGGIWVPSEYTTAAAYGGGQALYHQPSPHHHTPNHHFCAAASPVPPQDFYAPPMPPPVPALSPLSHHQQHHQLHLHNQQMLVYDKPTSQGRSSPESDIRGGGGDRSESIEDGKSESSSWKGESGAENGYGGERKGLAALREDGEESNGSEITLKF